MGTADPPLAAAPDMAPGEGLCCTMTDNDIKCMSLNSDEIV